MVRHRYLDSAFGQPNVQTFLIGRCEAQPFQCTYNFPGEPRAALS